MPLAFDAISHGRVAFGFFNIESDMLLLENVFFFSTTFCAHIIAIAENEPSPEISSFPGFIIDTPENIGDLMGAIHGIRHTGFIGAMYQRFPFPQNPVDFKQKPNGAASQKMVERLIADFGKLSPISFVQDPGSAEVAIGDYRFAQPVFHQLLDYVWRGGMPLWKDAKPPRHVIQMKEAVTQSRQPLFNDIDFTMI